MGLIQKLSSIVIDRIKAGEVVDRPVSIVKELVENAIDAGSTLVEVELLDGGKSSIRVKDNGSGLAPDDVRLAFERHATSKLKDVEDLEAIASFGFRGEALPSIASVSRCVMRSRESGAGVGFERILIFGEHPEEREVAMAVGTEIVVTDLFSVVPARLKFLKATATELSHTIDFLTAMSLAYANVGFILTHNGREVFRYAAATNWENRLHDVLGTDASEFFAVNFDRGSFAVRGFAGRPEAARSVPRHFVTFVNGRNVRDKVIRAGVLQAYSGLILKGMLPSCVLFVTVDPKWVDVNAHPAKTEVRFHDSSVVQELIAMGLQDAVKEAMAMETRQKRPENLNLNLGLSYSTEGRKDSVEVLKNLVEAAKVQDKMAVIEKYQNRPSSLPGSSVTLAKTTPNKIFAAPSRSVQSVQSIQSKKSIFENADEPSVIPQSKPFIPIPNVLFKSDARGPFSDANYLGQFDNCYLVLEVQGDMFVIDQHAFHERILYEEFTLAFEKSGVAQQELLAPVLVKLPRGVAGLVTDQTESILQLGFRFEKMNEDTLALHAFPAFLPVDKAASSFDEVLARCLALGDALQLNAHPLLVKAKNAREEWILAGMHPQSLKGRDVFHMFHATVACHSAVRAGDQLSAELVRRLLARAGDVNFFEHCPHGRPVYRRFSKSDVSQWFART